MSSQSDNDKQFDMIISLFAYNIHSQSKNRRIFIKTDKQIVRIHSNGRTTPEPHSPLRERHNEREHSTQDHC